MQASRLVCIFSFAVLIANAADVATVRGIVHDPQHRPLPNAQVVLKNATVSKTIESDANGEIFIPDVAPGAYTISISAAGFQTLEEQINVVAGKSPILHLQLEVASITSSIVVPTAPASWPRRPRRCKPISYRNRSSHTPGADQTNSLAMITDFTPGAYMVHDMLHMRGGHQVNWFFDGIPGDQHQHREQRRAVDQSEERGGTGGRARRIFERVRRSHLWLLQRRDAVRLRAR